MATVLVVSEGSGISSALKLADEGHVVRVHLTSKEQKDTLKGLRNPSLIGTVPKNLDPFDVILFDGYGNGVLAERFKEKDKPVIGSGSFNDKLELDREYGTKVVETLLKDLALPKSKTCKTAEEAISYLKEVKKPQVLKPFGNQPTYLTPVSETADNEVLVQMVKVLGQGTLLPCLIQEKVTGVEVSTEGWFDGASFSHLNHTIERKRLLEGDKGPMLGCAGNVVWTATYDKLFEVALLPLTELLQKVDYLGPIDVNCICTKDKAYFLEFTPRFGHDALQALTELMRKPFFDYLWALQMKRELPPFRSEYSIAVRLTLPPHPYDLKDIFKNYEGMKVFNIPVEARRHIHLYDVKFEEGEPVTAGVDGCLGCVTARGETIRECRRRVYRTIKNITQTQDVQYRLDIGEGMDKDIEKLKEWGWIDV